MGKINQIERLLMRSQQMTLLVIALALAVLAGVVALTTLQVRARIREQIAGRDGEALYAVASMLYAQDVEDGLEGPISDPGNQLNLALKSSQLRGVLGVRLFHPDGHWVESFPDDVTILVLATDTLPKLKRLQTSSRFLPRVPMRELFYPDQNGPRTGEIPLLEVNVPLHAENGPLAGIAQFLVEGHSIAAEYSRLDRHLARQGLAEFTVGGALLSGALAWAFRRLRRAQRLLAERTENLVKANQELALAAKTSALGAVTAHLIHGLKNPLAGLQSFVAARGSPEVGEEADWQQAVASTRRMRVMINQVIGVLREEQAGASYEVTLRELEETVRVRVQPLARERSVNFASRVQAEATLPNRAANLVALILVNLSENAVQATPGGKTVRLTMNRAAGRLVFEVADEGPGFPADTPLFMPCHSAKEGGTGIGLAVCKQLANHLGAELALAASTPDWCVFALSLAELQAHSPCEARVRERSASED
jgi:signal transduction histidine kinase